MCPLGLGCRWFWHQIRTPLLKGVAGTSVLAEAPGWTRNTLRLAWEPLRVSQEELEDAAAKNGGLAQADRPAVLQHPTSGRQRRMDGCFITITHAFCSLLFHLLTHFWMLVALFCLSPPSKHMYGPAKNATLQAAANTGLKMPFTGDLVCFFG